MAEPISQTLEAQSGITCADSWPTGSTNAGPEEYGFTYNEDTVSREEVLDSLERTLIDASGPGFHLTPTSEDSETEYDLIVTVHYHPLSSLLSEFFANHDSINYYGIDWSPEYVQARYGDSPTLDLLAPGTLEAWFETENDDYDAVLDDLEDNLPEWVDNSDAALNLEVYSADDDHCHLGLSYVVKTDLAAVLEDEYDLTPSPVIDDAGQRNATVYTAEWLPDDIYITRDGVAHVGDKADATEYDPDNPHDVIAFREMVYLNHEERYVDPSSTQ